jgi:SAM-dependent methyltransferase
MPAPARRRLRRLLGRDGAAAGPATTSDIDRIYAGSQSVAAADRPATDAELRELADAWQDADIPAVQRRVVDVQLANLAQGKVDPVFAALAEALRYVDLPRFSILDAACASGYYSEVIRVLDQRPIAYEGCDYSPAMIESARAHEPGVPFSVEDLTALTKADDSFDVVLLAGVLEHIPDYPKALGEAGRVAREYLIVHRCPTVDGPEHLRTIGTQYNVLTPRTFFSLPLLGSEIAAVGFDPVATIDVYPAASSQPKSGSVAVDERGAIRSDRTLTLVFRRRASAA